MPAAATAPKKSAGIDTARSKRPPSTGKTVSLRATQRGQYGHPVANIIEPGTVFSMVVKDLEQRDVRLKAAELIKDDSRREATVSHIEARDTKEIDGIVYLLPTWTEDAANPVVRDEDEATDPVDPADRNEDVI